MRALFAALLLPLVWLMLGHAGDSQNRERLIERKIQRDEPVEIEEIQVRDIHGLKSVKTGTKFGGDEDWLKGLTLRLKNSTNKAIAYVEVRVYVPTSDTEDQLAAGYSRDAAEEAARRLRERIFPRQQPDNQPCGRGV